MLPHVRIPVDRRALIAIALGLLCAPLVGMLVASSPVPVGGMLLALGAGTLLFPRPQLMAFVLVGTFLFDAFFLNVGFALLSPGDLSALLLVGVWVPYRMARPAGIRWMPALGLLLAYTALCLVSGFFGVDPGGARGHMLRLCFYVVAAAALIDLLTTERALKTVLWLLLAAGVIHAVYAFQDLSLARLDGMHDQPNVLGHYASICAVACLGLMSIEKRRVPWLVAAGSLALLLACIVLTVSRGAYLALGLTLLWWVRHRRTHLVLLALLAATVAFALPHITERSEENIQARMTIKDTSVSNRWITLQNGLTAIAAHPLLGVGFAQFGSLDQAVEVTAQRGRGAHNFYLSAAASTGLPALALLLALMGGVYVRLARWRRRLGATVEAEMADRAQIVRTFQAMWIYMALALITKGPGQLVFWTVLALCNAAALLPQDRKSDPRTPA